ncbi:MAG: hypothetical protein RLZZ450_5017 [Pseudomonadota bacterium]|jgi:hypothetical protein
MKLQRISLVASCLLVAIGLAGFALAKPKSPTKGRVPPEAFKNGEIRPELVPDFIMAYNREGEIAGYVSKVDVFREGNDEPYVVVDESLTKPVGRMVPGRGFVPIGVPETSVPMLPPGTEVDQSGKPVVHGPANADTK